MRAPKTGGRMQATMNSQIFSQNLNEKTLTLTGLLFLSLSIPMAGQWESLDTLALEDSHQDMNMPQLVEKFEKNLPRKNKGDAKKLSQRVLSLSRKYSVSPGIVVSVIETESSYRYGVVSKAGAVGLMQLRPSTAKEVSKKYGIPYSGAKDLLKPEVNMELGVAYLSYLRSRFGHSVHYLAAYNMGPTAMKSRINHGNYELGAIKGYVEKIHGRTLTIRASSKAPLKMLANPSLATN